jgi:beta-glucanase (GH16 family)
MKRKLLQLALASLFACSFSARTAQATNFYDYCSSFTPGTNWVYDYGVSSETGEIETLGNYAYSNGSYIIIKSFYSGGNYYSAKIKSVNTFQYGTIAATIKVTGGTGAWPAFWMMGDWTTYTWPTCGEIDIMENLNNSTTVYCNSHWYYYGNQEDQGYKTGITMSSWHTYGIVWSSSSIKYYVDGVWYKTHTISTGQTELTNAMNIYLNLAIGGEWSGWAVPSPSYTYYMYIDKVAAVGTTLKSAILDESEDIPETISDINVYPNPLTSGPLTIDLNGLAGESTIRVYNLNGSLIEEQRVSDVQTAQIDMDTQASGQYIVQVTNSSQVITRKVLVSR